MEKRLLDFNEFCEYMSLKKTTARNLLSEPRNPYVVRIGRRVYVDKKKLDKWIDDNSGNF